MGDCVVEDGHVHHPSDEVEGAVPLTVAVELDERAGESREEGGGQRKKVGGIRREPSFSRWCRDTSVAAASNTAVAAAISDSDSDDSEEFDLPLLPSSSGGGSSPMDIEAGATVRSDDLPISPRLLAKVIGLIACWYTLSTCLTLYNKEMLGKHMWKFPAPFLMNTVHFTMQAVASRAIVWFQQRGLEGGPNKMSWKDYCLRVVPTALATALDINLSNISLVFITVTFATMCKSASPIFILLFAFMFRYFACYSVFSCMGLIVFSFSNFSLSLNFTFLFGRLEKPSFSLLGIMLVVSFGVLLTVAKETEFNLWGFIFIMLAAVMSGFRWSMTQILLQVCYCIMFWQFFYFVLFKYCGRTGYLVLLASYMVAFPFIPVVTELLPLFLCPPEFLKKEEYGLKNPFTLMSHVTPVMAIVTAIISIVMDPWHDFRASHFFDSSAHIIRSSLLLLLGGALAFFMVLTEYVLVSVTSAVTVTVAGIVKEAVTILVAVLFFNDPFTWLKALGLAIIIFGVSLFNIYKYKRFKKGHYNENAGTNTQSSNWTSKYVILDEDTEAQDDTG
ncbi:putative sugar phosphate/phosphate translocator [Zea mays]|uniref:Putative sugar phosphate/phosphate translocator n=2 Tax=Zea mays TaxID=4577 RepID=A0A1D6NCE4_MAIZE|nr:putative sugar phosphate/phosphate translocator [Zea mays]